MYKLIIGLLFITQQLTAQTSIIKTGSNLTTKEAEAILSHHNTARQEAGTPALIWSTSLASYAQQWADFLATKNNGNIKHRDQCGENGKQYGENIFWGSSAALISAVEASHGWYSEKKKYKYRTINPSSWYPTGHYTQMIWKNTKEMGAGMAVCANGAIIVVANYYPAGNVIGEYPY